jgi:hypothetical protein
VFTARYALSPYIKQIRFVFKELKPTNARKCIILTVSLLQVSATNAAIFREVHYKEYIKILQKLIELMHRYKILNFKNIWFKIYAKN